MKGEEGFNHFQFGTFGGRFKSDNAASMAVRGLKVDLESRRKQDCECCLFFCVQRSAVMTS